MIKILHRGIQINLDLNTTNFTGVATTDNQIAYLKSLVAGKMVGVDTNGKVALADNQNVKPLGFVCVDASANPLENYPSVGSQKLAVAYGDCVIETDQLEASITFAAGDLVYASKTSGSVGMLTNVQPSWTVSSDTVKADPIGIALNATSSSVKTLKVARL